MKKFLIAILLSLIVNNIFGQKKEFIAMEYVGGIGNRILKVRITDSLIFAAKVKGLTSETTPYSFINDTELVIPNEVRDNPNVYVQGKKELLYLDIDFDKITPEEFLRINSSNFVIRKRDISSFYHNPKKKWGMGNYPHNGRIFIVSTPSRFNKKEKREFILVGEQDEKPILEWIGSN
jgi:hypothetical protein